MGNRVRQKFESILPSEIIERDDKFYARLDDYFENEKEYGGHWKYFSQTMPPLKPTTELQELMKRWDGSGIIASAEDAFTQPIFSLIDYICLTIDATLQRLDVGIKTRLKVAEHLRTPYKHSHCGLLEFYACYTMCASYPVEVILMPKQTVIIGGFYEFAFLKESEDFLPHISISLNHVIQNFLGQKLEVKFDKSVMLTNKEAKILYAVQQNKLVQTDAQMDVQFKQGEPQMLTLKKVSETTDVHEALSKSSPFGELRVRKSDGKVSFIEEAIQIKL